MSQLHSFYLHPDLSFSFSTSLVLIPTKCLKRVILFPLLFLMLSKPDSQKFSYCKTNLHIPDHSRISSFHTLAWILFFCPWVTKICSVICRRSQQGLFTMPFPMGNYLSGLPGLSDFLGETHLTSSQLDIVGCSYSQLKETYFSGLSIQEMITEEPQNKSNWH